MEKTLTLSNDLLTVTPKKHFGPSPERIAELSAAFDRVRNADHWKNRIDAVISIPGRGEEFSAAVALISEAVTFYTGSVARFTPCGRPTMYRVTAAGYFATIGA